MESKVRVVSVEDARQYEVWQTRGNTLRVKAECERAAWQGVTEIVFLCHAAQHPKVGDEITVEVKGLLNWQAKTA